MVISFKTKYLFFFGLCINFSSTLAENPCTPIDSVPTIITKSGSYCLQNNLYNQESKNAITISVSGVIIDLKNHTLSAGVEDPGTKLFGVYSKDVRDITIKNGIIRNFMYGIYLSDSNTSSTGANSLSGGYKIENVKLVSNYFRGMRLEGANHTVIGNTVRNTGGSIVFDNSFAIGIEIIGPGAKVESNTVVDTYSCGNGESVAISFSNNNSGSEANRNRIINYKSTKDKCLLYHASTGRSFGIWVGGNPSFKTNAFLRDNIIDKMYYGFAFSSPTTGSYGNNLVRGATCNFLVVSDSVSTFNYVGSVACPSITTDEIDEINRHLISE